ncbi:MAG: carnitine dehydratase [Chloroflexi bacterium]|nr:carnitine dehydratase [Chloroflexota bacterium]MDP6662539.1 CoA transferase [SAR202 cluster bacterium]MDP6799976.1 CoA transferase [SAR202 cluster bacterium]
MNAAYEAGASGPLKGVRVLDWTMWQFGPMSSAMMGDMGADVLKIEALDGDSGRGLARASTLRTGLPEGRNVYFETNNRNKRGLAVNLKTKEGQEIVHKLVKNADVFVQNFRKGVAERLNVGYETLSEINPMLIYGSASGYGPEGPDAHLPSFDGCGQARAGLMMSATPVGVKEPTRVTQGVSDQMGAIMLCQGVLAALVARHIQGIGQKVDASHLSANMWLQGLGISMTMMRGGAFEAYDRLNSRNPLANLYECKDERWIQLMHLQPDRQWEPLMTIMGLTHLLDDPRFSNMDTRMENGTALVAEMDKAMATKTYDEWDELFRTSGDFIYAKVQTINELQDDPQVIANEYITEFDHPSIGTMKMCNHPNHYSKTPAKIWREAPQLGQHTEEVLIDELGYTWDDISDLQNKNVIL